MEPKMITIRELQLGDRDQFLKLQLFPTIGEYKKEKANWDQLYGRIHNENKCQKVFVITKGGYLVGAALISWCYLMNGKRQGQIIEFTIASLYEGHGYDTQIIRFVTSHLFEKKNCVSIIVTCPFELFAFYENLGFTQVNKFYLKLDIENFPSFLNPRK